MNVYDLPLPDFAIPYENYIEFVERYGVNEDYAPHTFWRYVGSNDVKQKFFVVSIQFELWNYDRVAYAVVNYRSVQHGYKRHIRVACKFNPFNTQDLSFMAGE